MSKKKKESIDLDKAFKSAELDDYEFKKEDLGCTLIRDFPKRDKPNFDWEPNLEWDLEGRKPEKPTDDEG